MEQILNTPSFWLFVGIAGFTCNAIIHVIEAIEAKARNAEQLKELEAFAAECQHEASVPLSG